MVRHTVGIHPGGTASLWIDHDLLMRRDLLVIYMRREISKRGFRGGKVSFISCYRLLISFNNYALSLILVW